MSGSCLGITSKVRGIPFKGATGHVVEVRRRWWSWGRRVYVVHLDGQVFTGGKRVKAMKPRKIGDEEQRHMKGEK